MRRKHAGCSEFSIRKMEIKFSPVLLRDASCDRRIITPNLRNDIFFCNNFGYELDTLLGYWSIRIEWWFSVKYLSGKWFFSIPNRKPRRKSIHHKIFIIYYTRGYFHKAPQNWISYKIVFVTKIIYTELEIYIHNIHYIYIITEKQIFKLRATKHFKNVSPHFLKFCPRKVMSWVSPNT